MRRYRRRDSSDTSDSERDTDTDSATSSDAESISGSESDRSSHRAHSRHSSKAALLRRHDRRKHDTGSKYLWAGGMAAIILVLLAGAWYFLVGPGADDSDTGSIDTSSGRTGSGSISGGSGGSTTGAKASSNSISPPSSSGSSGSPSASSSTAGGSDATATGTGSSSAATSTPTSGGEVPRSGKYIGGFWEAWGKLSLDEIPYDKYTHLYWFVAIPDEKGAIKFPDNESLKGDFISKCKAAGAKALFSLGGWTGSEHFSALLSKEDSRKALVESIKKEMATGWDGVDIDFEYPGRAGATEDFDLVNDLPNFLSLFKELREALGKEAIITTDTSAAPWLDPTTGKPSTDLKAFAEPIDFFGLMLYDVWGSGTTSGPNFPYSAKCSPKDQPWAYPDTTKLWIDAGVPPEKIVVGLAAYGHAWTIPKFDDSGAAAGASSPVFQQGTPEKGDGSVLTYSKIVAAGTDGSKQDDCTESTYMFKDNVLTIWDNPDNTAKKASTAKDLSLAGCMLYALSGDNGDLVDAMIKSC